MFFNINTWNKDFMFFFKAQEGIVETKAVFLEIQHPQLGGFAISIWND